MACLNRTLVALGAACALVLSACSGTTTTSESSDAAETGTTSESSLATLTEGKLTIATGQPAFSPWVENDDPASGQGFEAAVAYAVAEQLGFAKEDVVWVRSTFDSAIAPGAKDWDFNLQQFSITDERKQAVDFSTPYYTTSQAVLTVEGSAAASATSLADLKDLQFGVQVGTTSQETLEAAVELSKDVLIFNNSVDVVQALKGGQVDAVVVDLPTALYLSAVGVEGGTIIGQFEDHSGGDNYGLVLPKGSALTEQVSAAVDVLRENGTLAALEKTWLSDAVSVPVLK
ncbi:ABC transporter substrate-binding protein [Schaalia suimastitidis]|uniref:ABC transporter substrate-binding protein n=1 Tax=Schaalia suimastitidis TaxID=121163 RepID=UPI000402042F|nr:ABC transporter substrate-binding protein [Schaalia suimastitidis]